jgi:SAM-dependent methyltransferase
VTAEPPRERSQSAEETDPAEWIARRVPAGEVLVVGRATVDLVPALQQRGANVSALDEFGAEIPFTAGRFDAVVLDGIVEHSLKPERVLTEARRILKDEGVLAIAARYGLHADGDHADALYLRRLAELLAPAFSLEAIELAGDRLVAAAEPGAAPADPVMLLEVAERRLAEADARLYQAERELQAQKDRGDRLQDSVEKMKNSRGWMVARAVREGTKNPKNIAQLPRLVSKAFRRKP